MRRVRMTQECDLSYANGTLVPIGVMNCYDISERFPA